MVFYIGDLIILKFFVLERSQSQSSLILRYSSTNFPVSFYMHASECMFIPILLGWLLRDYQNAFDLSFPSPGITGIHGSY